MATNGGGVPPSARLNTSRRSVFLSGMQAGIPIGLGYFAVAFSLGIAARNAGFTAFLGFLISALGNASAGEYAVITLVAADATYLELAVVTLITNARYLLMSCALSQRAAPELSLGHRLLVGYYITDELFAIAIARPGNLDPLYSYGAICVAAPCWAFGTSCGVIAGNSLPASLVSAFSVALYGMFLAIIIPAARKDRVVLGLVLCSFAASWAFSVVPVLSGLSGGTQTILLTVILSSIGAILFPVHTDEEKETEAAGS